MDKTIVTTEIDDITDTYCEDCFLKEQLVKDRGKIAAHRFCIATCTVGEQLQFLGREMLKFSK